MLDGSNPAQTHFSAPLPVFLDFQADLLALIQVLIGALSEQALGAVPADDHVLLFADRRALGYLLGFVEVRRRITLSAVVVFSALANKF